MSSEEETNIVEKKEKNDKKKKTLESFSTKEKKETSYVFPLSSSSKIMKRVQVHKFKGKSLMDIRELYMADDDEWRPTKKGISLSIDQYKQLKKLIPLVDEAFESFGEKVDVSDSE